MERSEPSLVPEWLKSSGSVTGGGTSAQPLSSSLLHSDDRSLSKLARNKSSVNGIDNDLGRSPVSDRTSSSYFRRSSSSNGSADLRSYSSFCKNQHGRDWDKDINESRDKDKLFFGEHKHRDHLDPLGNIFPGRFEKDGLRCSHLMISGKHGEAWPKKTSADSSTATRNNNTEGNGLPNKGSSVGSMQKAAFERDFPSLGSEERQAAPDRGRVPSLAMSSAIHGLPISVSTMIGGDKWISALAEVPALVGSNSTGISCGQQSSFSSSRSLSLSTNTGLNMAEAVALGPPHAQTAPQSSTGTQRLEELAIKQSRQLIPVTPSLPKPLVLNSSDKVKTKVGQQQNPNSSSLLSPSFRGGPAKTDVSKTSTVGKLHLLKPARERNGVSPSAKDSLSPTNSGKCANSACAPSVTESSTSRGTRNNSVSPRAEQKHVLTMLEKRPTSQAQSRNDFFNLVRKRSMENSSSVPDPSLGSAVSPSTLDTPDELDAAPLPATQQTDVAFLDSLNGCQSTENKGKLICNGDAFDEERYLKKWKNRSSSDPISSEEEEAAFLRSLGWEENADEDGGLTEEEINAFYRDVTKYINSKPPLKILQGVQPRFSLPLASQVATVGGVSSGLSSSDSKLES